MKPERGSWRSSWNQEVGYKRPPKSSQYQPGKSGNPKGRRRKQKGPRQLLEAALNEAAMVTENGVSRALPKMQVIYKVLVANAIKGHAGATSILFRLIQDYGISKDLEPAMNEMIIKFVRPGEKKD